MLSEGSKRKTNVRSGIQIIVVAGLVAGLAATTAHAGNRNPWTLYQRGGQIGGNSAAPNPTGPSANLHVAPQTNPSRPQQFGNDYVPLNNGRNANRQPGWPGGYYGQYGRSPYGVAPGYGYQLPFQGGLGGQFGFGMSMNPGFGFSGMPSGYGYPSMPFFGGGNPYGSPYGNRNGGFSPFGMGFPMF